MMTGWIYFWAAVVLFSTVSFTYMSGKILYKAISELKDMFKMLDDRQHSVKSK